MASENRTKKAAKATKADPEPTPAVKDEPVPPAEIKSEPTVPEPGPIAPIPSDPIPLETAEQIIGVLAQVSESAKILLKDARARKDKDSVALINTMLRNITSVRKPIEKLQRTALQQAAAASKRRRSPKAQETPDGQPKPPTGFKKPQAVTDELATFIGIEPGTLISRVDVTRKLCDYIRVHDLQNQQNRREIYADPPLAKLLRHDAAVPLTYYNLQSKIQIHFVKADPTAAAKPVPQPAAPAKTPEKQDTKPPAVLKVLRGKVVV